MTTNSSVVDSIVLFSAVPLLVRELQTQDTCKIKEDGTFLHSKDMCNVTALLLFENQHIQYFNSWNSPSSRRFSCPGTDALSLNPHVLSPCVHVALSPGVPGTQQGMLITGHQTRCLQSSSGLQKWHSQWSPLCNHIITTSPVILSCCVLLATFAFSLKLHYGMLDLESEYRIPAPSTLPSCTPDSRHSPWSPTAGCWTGSRSITAPRPARCVPDS